MVPKIRHSVALVLATLSFSAGFSATARAQAMEERFQDLFVTAGYCTAFGAALGTAFLAWTEEPAQNLKYVAVGASLGFIGGSLLGSYIIFSPVVIESAPGDDTRIVSGPIPDHGVVVRPTYNRASREITAVEAGKTLFTF